MAGCIGLAGVPTQSGYLDGLTDTLGFFATARALTTSHRVDSQQRAVNRGARIDPAPTISLLSVVD